MLKMDTDFRRISGAIWNLDDVFLDSEFNVTHFLFMNSQKETKTHTKCVIQYTKPNHQKHHQPPQAPPKQLRLVIHAWFRYNCVVDGGARFFLFGTRQKSQGGLFIVWPWAYECQMWYKNEKSHSKSIASLTWRRNLSISFCVRFWPIIYFFCGGLALRNFRQLYNTDRFKE